MSSQAKASVENSLNVVKPKNDVKAMFNDAKPTISKVIAEIACLADSKQIGKYTDPDNVSHLHDSIKWYVSYHKSGCLDVARINGIEKKSNNAFKFLVTYVSPQSGESVRRGYTAIKQPEGDWLFKWSEY